ncbi:MAG: hypothetical protein U1F55_06725 [Chitinivorax sp.]
MLIDSHCHINFPELADQVDLLMAQMRQNHVSHALCVAVNLPDLPSVLDMATGEIQVLTRRSKMVACLC